MNIPPPGGMADELLWHLRNCPTCKIARATRFYCPRGRELITLTLKERHG